MIPLSVSPILLKYRPHTAMSMNTLMGTSIRMSMITYITMRDILVSAPVPQAPPPW
jgi:hypothetical protein